MTSKLSEKGGLSMAKTVVRENESIEENLAKMRQNLNNLSESYDKLHEVIKA